MGERSGSYAGRESGRTGSVFFRLASDADSAYGDVLMAPVGFEHPLAEGPVLYEHLLRAAREKPEPGDARPE